MYRNTPHCEPLNPALNISICVWTQRPGRINITLPNQILEVPYPDWSHLVLVGGDGVVFPLRSWTIFSGGARLRQVSLKLLRQHRRLVQAAAVGPAPAARPRRCRVPQRLR